MEGLLSITEEFYTLNNVSANHKKYVLMSSKHANPSPVNFTLSTSSLNHHTHITIPSTPHKEAFRFLGVWFDFLPNSSFVSKQLANEYKTFSTLLQYKPLSNKQLTYLHNVVLIPKLEYRAQVSFLSSNACTKIVSPFKSLFKRKVKLASCIPDVALYASNGYKITNLYNHLLKCILARLYNLFNSPDLPTNFILIDLLKLRFILGIPYSPTQVIDWSPWLTKRKLLHHYLIHSFQALSLQNLTFDLSPTLLDLLSIKGGTHALCDIFPQIHAKYLTQLLDKHLFYLSQLVDHDGTYIQSWAELCLNYKFHHRIPIWFKTLLPQVCEHVSSRQLLARYYCSETFLSNLPLPLVNPHTKWQGLWSTYWHPSTSRTLYGRIIFNSSSKTQDLFAIFTHWILDPSDNSLITPQSKSLRLIRCPGCSLNQASSLKISNAWRTCTKGASCYLKIDFYNVLALETCTKKRFLTESIQSVDFKISAHYIESQLRLFAQRLRINPVIDDDELPPSSPLPQTFELLVYHLQHNNSVLENYQFYTDGSLTNLCSPDMRMDFGWVQVVDDLILASHSASIPCFYPSASRAEISAIAHIISNLPDNSTIELYTDSLSSINTLQKYLLTPTLFKRTLYKIPNHLLWGSVADDIFKKNLIVKIFKVPAHSGNLLNDRADALARVATSSSPDIPSYTPSTHSSFFSTRIVFNSSLPLEINPRSFYSTLCDAAFFEQFLSLDRMVKYKNLSLHINWVITWSFFNYTHQFTSQYLRSKMESFQRTFKLKLLYEELPLMNNLIRRRPDLYQDAPCFHCSTSVETQDHLWTCHPASHLNRRSRLQDFQSIVSLARDSLISTLRKKWKSQSLHKYTVITQILYISCNVGS